MKNGQLSPVETLALMKTLDPELEAIEERFENEGTLPNSSETETLLLMINSSRIVRQELARILSGKQPN